MDKLAKNKFRPLTVSLVGCVVVCVVACSNNEKNRPANNNAEPLVLYRDVTVSHLPRAQLRGLCMDATHGDVDGDGDIDLVLAQEFNRNLVLINDGAARFTATAVPYGDGDNEDVLLRDFDRDGDLDLITVHEDDAVHGYMLNDGSGLFIDVSSRIPVKSIANAAVAIDVDGNGYDDVVLGNQGPNQLLMNRGGEFILTAINALADDRVTQDLLLLDADGDGDQDLFVANETRNQLLINHGSGDFRDESAERLPGLASESREADAADIDGDGDLDIVVGNVRFKEKSPLTNHLLVNDGKGRFSVSNGLHGLSNDAQSFTIRFLDIDQDGDQDILSADNRVGDGGTVAVWLNDGKGRFSDGEHNLFDTRPVGSVFDIEFIDLNADQKPDLYFCYRTGEDQLFLANGGR